MRTYTYTYQDSEGLRHEGEVQAKDKDEAYKTLRERGIRPMKVVEKIVPVVKKGIKGLRKRDVGAIGLGIVGVALVTAAVFFSLGIKRTGANDALPRHIVTLPESVVLEEVFPNKSHLAMARYAIPGAAVEEEVELNAAELMKPIRIDKGDIAEIVELKRIVIGMQLDARRYISLENGAQRYKEYLKERQAMERLRFADTLKRVVNKEISLEEGNSILRGMGLQGQNAFTPAIHSRKISENTPLRK